MTGIEPKHFAATPVLSLLSVRADQIAVAVDIHALAFNGPAANGLSGVNGAAQPAVRASTAKQPAMNGVQRGSSKAAAAGGKGALKGGEKKDPAQLKREQQLAEEAAVCGTSQLSDLLECLVDCHDISDHSVISSCKMHLCRSARRWCAYSGSWSGGWQRWQGRLLATGRSQRSTWRTSWTSYCRSWGPPSWARARHLRPSAAWPSASQASWASMAWLSRVRCVLWSLTREVNPSSGPPYPVFG